ncbi:MAG TPA: hypothetical protein VID48_10760 [Solirubrobacteraceae bacterium]
MKFRITRHSGFSAPADALELLWQRLESHRSGVTFTKVGPQLRATVNKGAPASMDRNVREEVDRLVVLNVVREVCEGAPELKIDWYAVGVLR